MIGLIAGIVWTLAGATVLAQAGLSDWLSGLHDPACRLSNGSPIPLAIFTGVCSTGLASFLGLELNVVGNAVSLPNTDLVIGAQCSGINSMISLTALAALAAYLLVGPAGGARGSGGDGDPFGHAGQHPARRLAALRGRLPLAPTPPSPSTTTTPVPAFFIVSLGLMLPLSRVFQCSSLRSEVI